MLAHGCGCGVLELAPAVVDIVWRLIGFCVVDHAGDFLEVVVEGVPVRAPGAVDGCLVVLWDAGRAPRVCDAVVEGGGPDEILFAGRAAADEVWTAGGVVEERLKDGTEGVEDVADADCDVLGEGSAVGVVVKETGAVGEGGGVLGELVEDGDGCGVGGRSGLEGEGELGGDVVHEGEEGVEVGEDDVAGRGVGAAGPDGGECVGAGPGRGGEGGDGCVLVRHEAVWVM